MFDKKKNMLRMIYVNFAKKRDYEQKKKKNNSSD